MQHNDTHMSSACVDGGELAALILSYFSDERQFIDTLSSFMIEVIDPLNRLCSAAPSHHSGVDHEAATFSASSTFRQAVQALSRSVPFLLQTHTTVRAEARSAVEHMAIATTRAADAANAAVEASEGASFSLSLDADAAAEKAVALSDEASEALAAEALSAACALVSSFSGRIHAVCQGHDDHLQLLPYTTAALVALRGAPGRQEHTRGGFEVSAELLRDYERRHAQERVYAHDILPALGARKASAALGALVAPAKHLRSMSSLFSSLAPILAEAGKLSDEGYNGDEIEGDSGYCAHARSISASFAAIAQDIDVTFASISSALDRQWGGSSHSNSDELHHAAEEEEKPSSAPLPALPSPAHEPAAPSVDMPTAAASAEDASFATAAAAAPESVRNNSRLGSSSSGSSSSGSSNDAGSDASFVSPWASPSPHHSQSSSAAHSEEEEEEEEEGDTATAAEGAGAGNISIASAPMLPLPQPPVPAASVAEVDNDDGSNEGTNSTSSSASAGMLASLHINAAHLTTPARPNFQQQGGVVGLAASAPRPSSRSRLPPSAASDEKRQQHNKAAPAPPGALTPGPSSAAPSSCAVTSPTPASAVKESNGRERPLAFGLTPFSPVTATSSLDTTSGSSVGVARSAVDAKASTPAPSDSDPARSSAGETTPAPVSAAGAGAAAAAAPASAPPLVLSRSSDASTDKSSGSSGSEGSSGGAQGRAGGGAPPPVLPTEAISHNSSTSTGSCIEQEASGDSTVDQSQAASNDLSREQTIPEPTVPEPSVPELTVPKPTVSEPPSSPRATAHADSAGHQQIIGECKPPRTDDPRPLPKVIHRERCCCDPSRGPHCHRKGSTRRQEEAPGKKNLRKNGSHEDKHVDDVIPSRELDRRRRRHEGRPRSSQSGSCHHDMNHLCSSSSRASASAIAAAAAATAVSAAAAAAAADAAAHAAAQRLVLALAAAEASLKGSVSRPSTVLAEEAKAAAQERALAKIEEEIEAKARAAAAAAAAAAAEKEAAEKAAAEQAAKDRAAVAAAEAAARTVAKAWARAHAASSSSSRTRLDLLYAHPPPEAWGLGTGRNAVNAFSAEEYYSVQRRRRARGTQTEKGRAGEQGSGTYAVTSAPAADEIFHAPVPASRPNEPEPRPTPMPDSAPAPASVPASVPVPTPVPVPVRVPFPYPPLTPSFARARTHTSVSLPYPLPLPLSLGLLLADTAAYRGCRVYSVTPGSAAAAAGVARGDVLAFVNNRLVRTLEDFAGAAAAAEADIAAGVCDAIVLQFTRTLMHDRDNKIRLLLHIPIAAI